MQSPDRVNIVKQYQPSCQGDHVDQELFYSNGDHWEYTDNEGSGAIVETVQRLEGESDQAFHHRLDQRSSEIDRELGCSRCYR